MFAAAPQSEFARAVRAGLTQSGQKELPWRYFYDDVGSALFEAITYLPEYGLTRADARVLEAHAGGIVEYFAEPLLVVELGSGSGRKTRWILEAVAQRQHVLYIPIDVSEASLERCARELGRYGDVAPVCRSYLEGLADAIERRRRGERVLVLFLGSSIGNFNACDGGEFLRGVRAALHPGDGLLLGTDLVKPIPRMIAAYDDPAGVTAAFNRNLLVRINRELGGTFELHNYVHEARYNSTERRIEMHLRSVAKQLVTVRDADITVEIERGETIFTEASHKYHADEICNMAADSGFECAGQWIDTEWPFAETLLLAA